MAKVIVWTNPSGGVAISEPCEKYLPGETELQYLDRVSAKTAVAIPSLVKVGYFEKAQLPATQDFFGQWRIDAGTVKEDAVLVKAEKWKRAKKKRDGLLDSAIESKMNADDDGDQPTVTKWKQYRKKLRDIEKDYNNPDDIVWPNPPT